MGIPRGSKTRLDLHSIGGRDGRPHPIDTESFDEAVNMLRTAFDTRLGEKDKSEALKRLHDVAVNGETKGIPLTS